MGWGTAEMVEMRRERIEKERGKGGVGRMLADFRLRSSTIENEWSSVYRGGWEWEDSDGTSRHEESL